MKSDFSRRGVLIGAGAAGLLRPGSAFATSQVWRATGQNMFQTVQGFSGGNDWSSCYRSRHYSNVPFRYARFVVPTFWNTGIPIADLDLPNSYHYQIGLEYPFHNGFSGIAPRKAVTFSGSNVLSYTPRHGPFGWSVSDIVDFGSTVPPGGFFGLWTTQENAAGKHSNSDSLPYQANASNDYQTGWQRYLGAVGDNSSLISAKTALTATHIPPVGSTQAGASSCVFAPCLMLIECAPSYPSVYAIGDSMCYGIGEGVLGSSTYGDSLGSALGNAGYLARWIYEGLLLNMVNLGRGSDGYKYFSTANWKYRLPLITLANPSHVVMQNIHNDIAAAAGGNIDPVLANATACIAEVKTRAPGAPILQVCCTPDTNSTDCWASAKHQTVAENWGNASSPRGIINNTYIRRYGSSLGNAGFIDVNPALEYGYREGVPSTETSLWSCPDATPYDETRDGIHPNSKGYAAAAKGIVAYLEGSKVANPFS